MLEYKPDKFAMYFNSNKIWQELWGFLNQKESIIRMETASDLNRPALEGVLELLEDRFEKYYPNKKTNKGEFNKLKQMTGHMIRQVMEKASSNNYSWFKYNVKLKKCILGKKAGFFPKTNFMKKLFFFQKTNL